MQIDAKPGQSPFCIPSIEALQLGNSYKELRHNVPVPQLRYVLKASYWSIDKYGDSS